MNILIVGCGKVGSKLASILSRDGHDVSIVDKIEANFDSLDDDFSGFTTTGFPIDLDILRSAGAESCDILAAVSSNDNVNIMVSQLAKEIFHIEKVITRIYDPKRKDVFSQFGINAICPTNLTVSSIISSINNVEQLSDINIGCHTISFYSVPISKKFIGEPISKIPLEDMEVVYAILHQDNSISTVNNYKKILESGDKLILSKILD